MDIQVPNFLILFYRNLDIFNFTIFPNFFEDPIYYNIFWWKNVNNILYSRKIFGQEISEYTKNYLSNPNSQLPNLFFFNCSRIIFFLVFLNILKSLGQVVLKNPRFEIFLDKFYSNFHLSTWIYVLFSFAIQLTNFDKNYFISFVSLIIGCLTIVYYLLYFYHKILRYNLYLDQNAPKNQSYLDY